MGFLAFRFCHPGERPEPKRHPGQRCRAPVPIPAAFRGFRHAHGGLDPPSSSRSSSAVPRQLYPPGDEEEFRKQLMSVSSPTWDEVFEDGGANEAKTHEQSAGEETNADSKTNEQAAWEEDLDDSMDLFGDDEAFLQMTIPDIHTSKNHDTSRTSPGVEDIATSAEAPLETCDTGIKHTVVSKSVELSDSLDFPVNFDLGYSLEDSEEEEDAMPLNTSCPRPPASLQEASPCVNIHSSTPYSFHRPAAPSSSTKFSTPQMLSERKTTHLVSPLTSKGPVSSGSTGPRAVRLFRNTLKRKRPEDGPTSAVEPKDDSDAHRAECILDSDDDVVVHKRRHGNKVNPLSSPEAASIIVADADSPLVRKKRVTALNISEADDDDDFQSERVPACKKAIRPIQQINTKRNKCQKGREFLDEEAVLSEGAAVSSDEDDGKEQNRSLDGFVVDNTHLSQGLNDSEMRGIYLKSVQSPVVGGRYKMSYKNLHNQDIFSQVPEQDETYKEDSFVVGSQEEVEEEVESSEEAVELMPEDSYVDGRRQYATRRRVFLQKARAKTGASTSVAGCRAQPRSKRGRVLRLVDSSEEEEGVDGSEPPKPIKHLPQQKSSSLTSSTISKVSGGQREEQQRERGRQRIDNQHALSDQLDFEMSKSLDASKQPQEPPSTTPDPVRAGPSITETSICILVDSRCLSGSVELVTSLRQHHSATVHVCSLDGNYFVVSARMAVERHAQSDLASLQNRKRLAERLSSVQEHFERICLIVEKDRIKPGETTRSFQRTRCFDSTLSALVRTGVRLLWSDGPQQSAALLVELARLEQRKGHAVALPSSELSGRQDLHFYLSLPSVNYVHALNMSRRFGSVAQLVNSSVESLEHEGGMSRARAEEIYRFLHYSCDSFLVDQAGKSRETVTHTIRI